MAKLQNIDWLVQNGGDVTIGCVGALDCAATAVDGSQCLAMLVREQNETLMQLLERLDDAIESVFENEDGDFIDEING